MSFNFCINFCINFIIAKANYVPIYHGLIQSRLLFVIFSLYMACGVLNFNQKGLDHNIGHCVIEPESFNSLHAFSVSFDIPPNINKNINRTKPTLFLTFWEVFFHLIGIFL